MRVKILMGTLLLLGAMPSVGLAGQAPESGAGGLGESERAQRVEEVRAAEVAFARSVLERQLAAFVGMIDPAAVFVSGAEATVGKERIVADWAGFFAADAPYFEWHPEMVELSGDGTLGFTRGPWVMRGKRPDGGAFERQGLFNSVWQRQPEGGWRVIFDAGCSPCPACVE